MVDLHTQYVRAREMDDGEAASIAAQIAKHGPASYSKEQFIAIFGEAGLCLANAGHERLRQALRCHELDAGHPEGLKLMTIFPLERAQC